MLADAISPPIHFHTILTAWQTNPLALLSGALEALSVVWYLAAVRRLRAKGRHWPVARTVSFVAGVLTIVFSIQSGFAAYDESNFTAHATQHILLMSMAPFFLALSAPVTLAIQASRRRTQVFILKVLHHPIPALLANPLVATGLALGTMYAYFLSPLYEASLRHPLLHDYWHFHFLVSGILFAWVAVGIDPTPRRMGYMARVAMVFASVPFTTFLGVAILANQSTIAPQHTLADTHAGGAALWGVSELVNVLFIIVIAIQWVRSEHRRAQRDDSRLDREADGGDGYTVPWWLPEANPAGATVAGITAVRAGSARGPQEP
jgi:putative membrane protein